MEQRRIRKLPFVVALIVMALVTLTLFQLPESLVAQLRRNRPLNAEGSGWIVRLLALAAVAQAAYGGFVVLRPDHIRRVQSRHPKGALLEKDELIQSTIRTAAVMPCLTLVYGLAATAMTGERGGFWLFVTIALAQLAWYLRESNVTTRWIAVQPDVIEDPVERHGLPEEPGDYCPPLARGLTQDERVPEDAS